MKTRFYQGTTKTGKTAFFGNHPTDGKLIIVVSNELVADEKLEIKLSDDKSVYFARRVSTSVECDITVIA